MTGVVLPDNDFEQFLNRIAFNSDEPQDPPRTPCHDLWEAVLRNALRDATKTNSTGYLSTSDFEEVCENAGMDASRLRQVIKAKMEV